MRIAMVADHYYPHIGGVPEHCEHLTRQLRAWGHEVTIVTARMGGDWTDAPYVRRVGASIVIHANGGQARLAYGWRLTARLEQLFREERYDVVHVQGGLAPTFGIVAPWAAFRAGIPVVATFHTWFPRSVGYRVFRRTLQRMLDRHAATIAVSEPVISAMSRYFRANWEIIPNGVDVSAFVRDGQASPYGSMRGPRLLFLARLEPRNGLDTVLSAMPRILERFPQAELIVAGDGPWRRTYEERARPLGAAVRFAGRVLADRPALYVHADLFVSPTTRSSFGVTLLEAMACGTPMLLSDITGFRELIGGGREAVLVPPQAPDAWADAAIALLADPARRAAMAAAGVAKSARFAWPKVAEQVLAVYERVVR